MKLTDTKRYWICKGERRVVQNPTFAAKMLKFGITELPPELVSTVIGSYCELHSKTVDEWRRSIDLADGYILEPVSKTKGSSNGFCQFHDATKPSQQCDNPPVTRYQLYYTSPSLIRRFIRDTLPEYRSQYQTYLSL